MNYKTLTYKTRNEVGLPEIEIVYPRSLWRWILRMPARKERYTVHRSLDSWEISLIDAKTGVRPPASKEAEICLAAARIMNLFNDEDRRKGRAS